MSRVFATPPWYATPVPFQEAESIGSAQIYRILLPRTGPVQELSPLLAAVRF